MNANIAALPGDGMGPEEVGEDVRALEAVAQRSGHHHCFSERLMGGCAIDPFDATLTDERLGDCRAGDAVLLGAVGSPTWDDPATRVRPVQGLLALRNGLGVYANLRPVRVRPSLVNASPLKPERLTGVDIMVSRELTGGLYFSHPSGASGWMVTSARWTPWSITIVRCGASGSWPSGWLQGGANK